MRSLRLRCIPKKKLDRIFTNKKIEPIYHLNTNNFKEVKMTKSVIRIRISAADAHYGGNLVDGAKMLQLFGDVATELNIINDGDEGLFVGYEKIEFLAPVYAGDYIEAVGEIINIGNTSRKMSFEARKVIRPLYHINDSAAEVIKEPVVVCRAIGTCVVPKDKQRSNYVS